MSKNLDAASIFREQVTNSRNFSATKKSSFGYNLVLYHSPLPLAEQAEMLSASARLVADSLAPADEGTRGIASSDTHSNRYAGGQSSFPEN